MPPTEPAAIAVTPDRIRAVSAMHDLRLEQEDIDSVAAGLPVLLAQLATADPGDLGFGEPATPNVAGPGLGHGAA